MSGHGGRLFNKQTGEGGADQIYDGAAKSSFDGALTGKHSAAWEAKTERFKQEVNMAPDVDVHVSGIADSAAGGKPTASWAAAKPRFENPKPQIGAGEYETATSDFDKALKNSRPSPMMMTPEKGKGRSDGWMTNQDQVNTPAPTAIPGAFDEKLKKTSPSPFSHSGGDRFKDMNNVSSHGEPSTSAANVSDFDKASRNMKPSAAAVSHVDRFKAAYDIPSYGDPGATQSASDIERQQLETKIARQKAQAEAERNRVISQ